MNERERLVSLDALRGFDMFWIVGGREVLVALSESVDVGVLHAAAEQTEHVEWNGFRLWDLIFPLFLFLAGASLPFSLGSRLARGESRRSLHLFAVRRGLTLVLLGAIYNGLLAFDFEHQRYASVLGRIGLAWMFAAFVFLSCGLRGQIAWFAGLLVAYWLALAFVPVPGIGAGDLTPGRTLTDWVDRMLVPGRLHRGDRDPEGFFSTIPAISTALLGVFAGHLLRSGRQQLEKVRLLVLGGIACLVVGWAWSLFFPLNKHLWSSSFVLWAGGLSLLLLATFYWVIDVLGAKRWAFFFVVLGMNAITVYMLEAFVEWDAIVEFVVRDTKVHVVVAALLAVLLRWAVMYWLYRRRIFLRV